MFILLLHVQFSACSHPHQLCPQTAPAWESWSRYRMREGELLCGQGVTDSGPLRYNLQPELWLLRSHLSALPIRPGCFSSILVTSIRCNAHVSGELLPYGMLRYAAVFLQDSTSLEFTVGEKSGEDLLYPSSAGRCLSLSGRCFTQPTHKSLSAGDPLPPWMMSFSN